MESHWLPGEGDEPVLELSMAEWWIFAIEVKKSDVIGINDIEIITERKTHIY